MMLFIRKEVKELGEMIVKTHEDWCQNTFHFYNKKTGLSFWTSNGTSFLKIDGNSENTFNYFEQKYLMNCIIKAQTKQLLK